MQIWEDDAVAVLGYCQSLINLGGDPAVESLGLHGHAVRVGRRAEVLRAARAVQGFPTELNSGS